MKIETNAGALHAALKLMDRVVQKRSTAPVLGTVLFDGASVAGTDLDMTVKANFPAVRASGRAAIMLQPLIRLLSCLHREADIVLTGGKDGAKLTYPAGECEFPVCPPEDFPTEQGALTAKQNKYLHVDGAGALIAALQLAVPFQCKEETRYNLNGTLLCGDGKGRLRAMSCDGHRMMLANTDIAAELPPNIIVPSRAVRFLLSMGGLARLTFDDCLHMRASGHGVTLDTKLIDGAYPDYMRVVPDGTETMATVVFNRFNLERAIHRLRAVCLQGDRHGSIMICLAGDQVALASQGFLKEGDLRGRELVPVEAYDGPADFEPVSASGGYLLDMLSAFKRSAHVRFRFKDSVSPILIDSAGIDATAVLMPQRGTVSCSYARETFLKLSPPAEAA